jgi:hypothetical protein
MKTDYKLLTGTPEEAKWKTEAEELHLCASNDRDLYLGYLEPIEKNFMRKVKKGIFDPEKAVQAYTTVLRSAAKRYAKYYAEENEWAQIFPPAARTHCAKIFINAFIAEIPCILELEKAEKTIM